TPPNCGSHSAHHQEHQHCVCRVQEDVRQMMPPGAHSEQCAISHVRQPGEWMPVACVGVLAKSPAQPLPRQSLSHLRIGSDVKIIIKIDESVVQCRPENADGYQE